MPIGLIPPNLTWVCVAPAGGAARGWMLAAGMDEAGADGGVGRGGGAVGIAPAAGCIAGAAAAAGGGGGVAALGASAAGAAGAAAALGAAAPPIRLSHDFNDLSFELVLAFFLPCPGVMENSWAPA